MFYPFQMSIDKAIFLPVKTQKINQLFFLEKTKGIKETNGGVEYITLGETLYRNDALAQFSELS